MFEWLKREWTELLCILVAVFAATICTDYFAIENNFINFVVFMVTWLVSYVLCHYLIFRMKQ